MFISRPKIVIEDRLTDAQRAELSAAIAKIPTDLSALDYAKAMDTLRKDAQTKAGY